MRPSEDPQLQSFARLHLLHFETSPLSDDAIGCVVCEVRSVSERQPVFRPFTLCSELHDELNLLLVVVAILQSRIETSCSIHTAVIKESQRFQAAVCCAATLQLTVKYLVDILTACC